MTEAPLFLTRRSSRHLTDGELRTEVNEHRQALGHRSFPRGTPRSVLRDHMARICRYAPYGDDPWSRDTDLAELERLARIARPWNEDEEGSTRQINAINRFWAAFLAAGLDDGRFDTARATSDEMLDEALTMVRAAHVNET